ncbi:MAG TPA: LLM class oxidoreductase [Xanthobacteraceae bacterium]|jgi:luciferase-type oxidoreductase|nr:LLM class oxidoreductase [Xanthobacteraceae bacterium]
MTALAETTGRPAHMAPGYRRMFVADALTLGVFFPIEAFSHDNPTMEKQEQLAKRAEELGFAALWFRDVPLRDPSFGDVGQVYDPWVYLAWIAAHTREIALATGAIILPLRHPIHTAKAAASLDRLAGGRLVLGVATGDRPAEFPAFGVPLETRGAQFRENFHVLKSVLRDSFPALESIYGRMQNVDLVPKPAGKLPVLVTGASQQPIEWIAEHADGWVVYPRVASVQKQVAEAWNSTVERVAPGSRKPLAQSLYIDLSANPKEPPSPVHLGFRSGREALLHYFEQLRDAKISHVVLNLKYGRRPADEVLDEIGCEIVPKLAPNVWSSFS